MEFQFEMRGATPLLMHADDVEMADLLDAWRKDPKNKSLSVPGDDRSPPWTWLTYLYSDGEHLAIPNENIMVALRNGAAKIPHKKGATFKAMSQSCLLVRDEFCRFEVDGRQVRATDCWAVKDEPFPRHVQAARDLGFRLLSKRAKVGQAKHVRVRPRFDSWSASGSIETLDPAITPEVLASMFDLAGRYSGLADWRPSSPRSPGPWGMFTAAIKAAKKSRGA